MPTALVTTSLRARFSESVGFRILVAIAVLIVLTALGVVVSLLAFRAISSEFDVLSEKRVPAVRTSVEIIVATEHIAESLSELAVARTTEQVGQGQANFDRYVATLNALAEGPDATAMADIVGDVGRSGTALAQAQQGAIEASERQAAVMTELMDLSEQARALLHPAVAGAYEQLVTEGEAVIQSTHAVIDDLVNEDFERMQALLNLRAAANQLAGAAVAQTLTVDEALTAILTDTGTSARASLLESLDTFEALFEEDDGTMRSRSEAFLQVYASILEDTWMASQYRDDVVRTKSELEKTLSSIVDDMVFALVIDSEEAIEQNDATIRRLVNSEVDRIRQMLSLEATLNFYVADLMLSAMTADGTATAERSATSQAALDDLMKLREVGGAELSALIGELAQKSDPGTGLVALHNAEQAAKARVSEQAAEANLAALKLSALATTQINDALAGIDSAGESVSDAILNANVLILGVAVLTLIAGMMAPVYVSRTIVRPLRNLTGSTERLASGDLAPINGFDGRRDELGQMARALSVFRDNVLAMEQLENTLREVLANARESSESVANGSTNLSGMAADISAGASRQAASAQQASAAVEQMTANIRQSADNASQTEQIAAKSAKDARASGEAVSRAVEAMKSIAGKVGIVQEIARQTDLLALNAAVEAARAGEYGRGFAVVASEVRKLAERSQTAAAEIGTLSSETVGISGEAGRMLDQLVPEIQRTADLVQEISAATREQDIGAEQISVAIRELDTVIRQNADAAKEAEATTESLAKLAGDLQDVINQVKLPGGKDAGHADHPPREAGPDMDLAA